MIKLLNKRNDPLHINFIATDIEDKTECLFLWEDDYNKSAIYTEYVKISKNNSYFSEINKGISFFENNINFKLIRSSDYKILFEEKFINIPFLSGKKICYVSQNGHTGYAYAARNYIYQLILEKYDVYWNVSNFFTSTYVPANDCEKLVFNSLDRHVNDHKYDNLIVHNPPDGWDRIIEQIKTNNFCKKIYGLTTWETTRLNKNWISIINESQVNGVIVHSQFNKDVFKDSGVIKPIYVWYPDIFPILDKNNLMSQDIFSQFYLYNDGKYTKDPTIIKNLMESNTVYYNISQYSERKNLDQLLHVFCKKFTSNDSVCLFIKTFLKEFDFSQIEYLKYKFYTILKKYKNIPKIVFCFDNLNDVQIQSIHMWGDVYFTLNRGEGFGLCSYTAKKFGNKVICGKFGSEKEFLSNDDILINYTLGNTFNMHHFHNYYDGEDQKWAIYDDDEVLSKLVYLPKTIK